MDGRDDYAKRVRAAANSWGLLTEIRAARVMAGRSLARADWLGRRVIPPLLRLLGLIERIVSAACHALEDDLRDEDDRDGEDREGGGDRENT